MEFGYMSPFVPPTLSNLHDSIKEEMLATQNPLLSTPIPNVWLEHYEYNKENMLVDSYKWEWVKDMVWL